jgi:hypothetical protein
MIVVELVNMHYPFAQRWTIYQIVYGEASVRLIFYKNIPIICDLLKIDLFAEMLFHTFKLMFMKMINFLYQILVKDTQIKTSNAQTKQINKTNRRK